MVSKKRLLVMNKQRFVQTEQQTDRWVTVGKVASAPDTLPPGVYHLTSADRPAPGAKYDGVILHVEPGTVYQQVGKRVVAHPSTAFERPPEVGATKSISYDDSKAVKAVVADVIPTRSRGKSR